jgi:hypothetical protein
MSNKSLIKAILLVPLTAFLISPATSSAKEKINDIFLTNKNMAVAKGTKYDEVKDISFEIKAVKYKGKWGFINHKGKKVIDFKYDDVWTGELTYSFGELVIAVKKDGKWGFINEEGKVTVPPEYDDIKEAMFIGIKVKKDGKWGLVTSDGQIIIPFKYDDIVKVDGSAAEVVLDGKKGVVEDKKEIIPPKYDEVKELTKPYQVRIGTKWGYISEAGEEITPPKYDKTEYFREGLAAVKVENKWGFINMEGEEVIKPKYDDAGSFSESRARVKLNGKWGYIDTRGEEIIIPKYDEAGNFNQGLAGVCINGRWGLISKNGELKGKLVYDAIFNDEGMLFIRVNRDTKTGYINKEGRVVIPVKYDEVINYNDEAVVVRLDKKWGAYDSTGKLVIPLKYDGIKYVVINHDDKKGSSVFSADVVSKKKTIHLKFKAKSKKSINGLYRYGKWARFSR